MTALTCSLCGTDLDPESDDTHFDGVDPCCASCCTFCAPAVVDVRSPLSDPPDTTHGEEVA